MNSGEIAQIGLSAAGGELSFLALFFQAHILVKGVILILLASSVGCWAIIIDKTLLFARTRHHMKRFETVFWSGQSLDELYQKLAHRKNQGLAAVFMAAMSEWRHSHQGARPALTNLQQRIDRVMDLTLTREMERLEKNLFFLASIGAAAPFVGLFGTVWGIMTSFQAIAASKNTNLAVVAPGIAEALFATALGLIAAIPAVIAYNKFASDAAKINNGFQGFADEFSTVLSRQIDGQG